MSQIKRIISAFVIAALVITGINLQVGSGVANADCQSDWVDFWNSTNPGKPAPPMPPRWCPEPTQTQPTMTPLPTGPPNTAIPSPVSPTSPTTEATRPITPSPTADAQQGAGAGSGLTPANPPETTKPFELPGGTTSASAAAPTTPAAVPETGANVPPLDPGRVSTSVPASKRAPANSREAKQQAANCTPNPWLPSRPLKRLEGEEAEAFKEFAREARKKSKEIADKGGEYAKMYRDKANKPAGSHVDHTLPLRRLWSLTGFADLRHSAAGFAKMLDIANDRKNLAYLKGPWNESKGDSLASEYNDGWNPNDEIDAEITPEDLKAMCDAELEATKRLRQLVDEAAPLLPSEDDGTSDTGSTSSAGSESDAGTTDSPATTATNPATSNVKIPDVTQPETVTPTPTQTDFPTGAPEVPKVETTAPDKPADVPATTPADVPATTPVEVPEKKPSFWERNRGKILAATAIAGVAVVGGVCVVASGGACAAAVAGGARVVAGQVAKQAAKKAAEKAAKEAAEQAAKKAADQAAKEAAERAAQAPRQGDFDLAA